MNITLKQLMDLEGYSLLDFYISPNNLQNVGPEKIERSAVDAVS